MTVRQCINLVAFPALFLVVSMPMLGQGQKVDANAGAQQFARNCAGCHGADGRGGDKAPAIATMPSVVALSADDLIKIVHDGTPAGMPAFPQLGDAGIRAVVDYLRTLQGKTSSNAPAAAVVGDSNSGHMLFFGKAECSSCHMVKGEGGFIASDLTVYGQSRNEAAILKAIVTPDRKSVV